MINRQLKIIKSKIGKIKTFDWILVVISLAGILAFLVFFYRKSSYITTTISVGEDSSVYGTWWNPTGPEYWFANAFHEGQQEKNGLGKVQAEILNVYSYDRSAEHKTVYLKVKLNAVYNRAANTYTYKGMPVLVGSTIKLNFENVLAEGLVTEVGELPKPEKKLITVEAQIREETEVFSGSSGTKYYVADAIKVGDKVVDNNGLTLIEILNKRVVPASVRTSTSDGRVMRSYDPLRRDVYLTLSILTTQINDKYFFLGDIPILVDQAVPINTPTVSIFPIVTKFITK